MQSVDIQHGRKTRQTTADAGVTLRAVLLALVLIVVNNYWITLIEVRWYALDGTCLPLFITPVFILFALSLSNLAVRRFAPRASLRSGELLTVYIMIVTASTLASHDLLQNLFGTIGYAHYAANDSNQYATTFFRFLPDRLLITDPHALEGLYGGGASPWTWSILKFWAVPLALWGALMMLLIGMMMCLNIIIRKQWIENEKLVFPLVQLPMAMTSEDSDRRFYSNKLMWMGFGIAASFGLVNGLHNLFPSLPSLNAVRFYNVGALFTTSPWNALAWNALETSGAGFVIRTYPFAIGLAYFIPLDLCFSCWFFYLAKKLWLVFGTSVGWTSVGNVAFPYYESESVGAWLALGIALLVASIPYLRQVWRKAWTDSDVPEDASEASLYRWAFLGLGVGSVMLLGYMRWLGMSIWCAAVFFGIYFIAAIAITRVRAELGTPHEISYVNPTQIMVGSLGYQLLGPVNIAMMSTMHWFNRHYRSHPMPNQLEAFKMSEGTAIKAKALVAVLLVAAFVGILSAYWANLSIGYGEGGQARCIGFKNWVGRESFEGLNRLIKNQPSADPIKIAYMLVGAAIVVGLRTVRGAFVGWPFHPAGYALAVSYAIDYFWFSFLVGWFLKLLIVRYGGMKLHNALVPFFLGLILGDFFIGSVWAIVGPVMGQFTYRVFL